MDDSLEQLATYETFSPKGLTIGSKSSLVLSFDVKITNILGAVGLMNYKKALEEYILNLFGLDTGYIMLKNHQHKGYYIIDISVATYPSKKDVQPESVLIWPMEHTIYTRRILKDALVDNPKLAAPSKSYIASDGKKGVMLINKHEVQKLLKKHLVAHMLELAEINKSVIRVIRLPSSKENEGMTIYGKYRLTSIDGFVFLMNEEVRHLAVSHEFKDLGMRENPGIKDFIEQILTQIYASSSWLERTSVAYLLPASDELIVYSVSNSSKRDEPHTKILKSIKEVLEASNRFADCCVCANTTMTINTIELEDGSAMCTSCAIRCVKDRIDAHGIGETVQCFGGCSGHSTGQSGSAPIMWFYKKGVYIRGDSDGTPVKLDSNTFIAKNHSDSWDTRVLKKTFTEIALTRGFEFVKYLVLDVYPRFLEIPQEHVRPNATDTIALIKDTLTAKYDEIRQAATVLLTNLHQDGEDILQHERLVGKLRQLADYTHEANKQIAELNNEHEALGWLNSSGTLIRNFAGDLDDYVADNIFSPAYTALMEVYENSDSYAPDDKALLVSLFRMLEDVRGTTICSNCGAMVAKLDIHCDTVRCVNCNMHVCAEHGTLLGGDTNEDQHTYRCNFLREDDIPCPTYFHVIPVDINLHKHVPIQLNTKCICPLLSPFN